HARPMPYHAQAQGAFVTNVSQPRMPAPPPAVLSPPPKAPAQQQPQQTPLSEQTVVASNMMEFLGGSIELDIKRDVPRFFNDSNQFFVRYADGTVLTAAGLDEVLSLCEPQGARRSIAISLDQQAWMDMATFGRLCGFDYLAPEQSAPQQVKLIGQLEERRLTS